MRRSQAKVLKEIGPKFGLGVQAIQLEMAQVYETLGLDRLEREERRAYLFEVVCPVHRSRVGNPETDCAAKEKPPAPQALVTYHRLLPMVLEDERTGIIPPNGRQIVVIERDPRGRLLRIVLAILSILLLLSLGTIIYLFTRSQAAPSAPTPIVVTVLVMPPPASITSAPVTNPQPSPTSIPQTPTPLPPTATATRVPPTPTPTVTPNPNTPSGTRLKVGEPWKQEGVYLTLNKTEFFPEKGTGEIYLSFDIANETGSDISIALDSRNVTLETNNGTRFKPYDNVSNGDIFRITVPDKKRQGVSFNGSLSYPWLGDYFDPRVSYVLVTVRDWSRIKEAFWQIDIQH